MTPEYFATCLLTGIVDANMPIYRELFLKTSSSNASDPYWRRARELFQSLPDERKAIFFEVIQQISIDTLSSILAIIDGVAFTEGNGREGFKLYDASGARIDGNLQHYFLAEVESRSDI